MGPKRQAAWSATRELVHGLRSDLDPHSSRRFAFVRGLARANYEYLSLRPTVPTVDLLNFIPDAPDYDLRLRYQVSWWNIDANSLGALTAIAMACKATTIFEFGTYKGVTTRQLAESCSDATVVTIDLPPSSDAHFVPGELIGQSPARDRVRQEYGDSKTFDFSPYHEEMDLVFVDAGHEYPDVCADSDNALRMVKPGGFVVWDDYTSWTGVRRCVNELSVDLPIVHIAGTRLAVLQR